MQNYNFFNRTIEEIIMQKFKNLKQVEYVLQVNKQFEIIKDDMQMLAIRGPRQISWTCLNIQPAVWSNLTKLPYYVF